MNTDTLNNLIRDNHFAQHQINVQHRRNKANAAFRNGRPRDPNDITGPSSFGTAGFVAPGTFPYTIDFENDPTASVAAQTVVITQQLSSNLDWTTFQLNSFGFGSFNVTVPPGLTSYDTKVNAVATVGLIVDVSAVFNTNTGLLSWTFTSLDPTTLLPTTNALAGFLPPDDSAGDGEGYVSYSVSPSSSDTTGTVINAQAAVVFDTNAPIDTTELTNTIDAGAPTSTVAALSSTQTDSTFTVSWSGQDDANGSGIATYDIYVSENGGAVTPFLTNTTATSASFAGSPGDSYGFFSVATDNVGNVEATSNAAQATTTVVSDTVILGSDGTLSILGSTADDTIVVSKSAGQIMTTINGTAQTPISASSVTSIVLDAGDGNDTVTIDARVPAWW